MARSKEACVNHPQKFTARKCYYCKAPICTECQQKRYHHFFCSLKHANLWLLGDLWARYKPTRELLWLGLFILLSNLLLFLLFFPAQKQEPGGEKALTRADSTYAGEGWHIDSLRSGLTGRLQLVARGRENQSLNVVHNGRLVQSVVSQPEETLSLNPLQLKPGNNRVAVWALTASGTPYLVDSFTVWYNSARLQKLRRSVHYFKTSGKRVALTFDGGSSNKGTVEILDILEKNHIRCTLFLTGRFMENFPGLVRRMLADGHEIANHTYNHPHATRLELDGTNETRATMTEQRFKSQLARTDSIFSARFDQKLKPYWRAPFGEINPQILGWAAELGFRHIGWSARCDSWDWVRDPSSTLYRSAEQIKTHFLDLEERKGLSGKIILMHLGSERKKDFPYESLEALIMELKKRGYTFIKVSDFMKPLS